VRPRLSLVFGLLCSGAWADTTPQAGESLLHGGVSTRVVQGQTLRHEGHNFSLGLGLYGPWPGLAPARGVSVALELWLLDRRFDSTVPASGFTQVDGRMSLTSAQLTAGLRYATPEAWPLRLALAAGPGLYAHQLTVTGSQWGLPVRSDARSHTLGWYAGADLILPLGTVQLALSGRHWSSHGEFDPITEGRQALEMNYVGVGVGRRW